MSRPWNLPDRDATPERHVLARRRWLQAAGIGGAALAGGAGLWWWLDDGSEEEVLQSGKVSPPIEGVYPAVRSARFSSLDRPLTPEAAAARYCNFYEFSSGKAVWRHIGTFAPEPWTLEVTGLVARPRVYDVDDLLRAFPLEERVYRHRCVEAWAMAIPWTGFSLATLVKRSQPLPSAKFVRFVSFLKPEQASKQRSKGHPWPYTEGLTLAEATNELAFIATGMYGHPLLKQHGAPVRLVTPWKYGFKSAKSIVRIEFLDHRPATFWNTLVPHEYDFSANVNPQIPHPRWSQARERMLGSGEMRATQLYNGYAEWVGRLYT